MKHFFISEGWLYRCSLPLRNTRLTDSLNAHRNSIYIDDAEIEPWPPLSTGTYHYKMSHTIISLSRIILAHETRSSENESKATLYEKRIAKKLPTRHYEFHLANGMVLIGSVSLKNDDLTLSHPFLAVTNFQLWFRRPDDPRSDRLDYKTFPPFAGLSYVILNTVWVQHYHQLMAPKVPI
jgi:hypothetical protein